MSLYRITESKLIDLIKETFLKETIEFESPVGPQRITSSHGNRNPRRRGHAGIDLGSPVGTPIVSPFDGKVIRAKTKRTKCGGEIFIKHDNGFKTRYCHCSDIIVSKGDTVRKGQVVGATGGKKGAYGSGNSQGPHLHFELYKGGKHVDPENYFDFSKGVRLIDKGIESTLDTSNLHRSEIAKLDTQDINTIVKNGDNSLIFKRGSKGKGVQEIQNILLSLGYELPRFGADGVYGGETKSAVMEFQKDNNLKIDGIVGIETATKLKEKRKTVKLTESQLVEMLQRIITERKKKKSKKKKSNTLCARGKRAAKAKFEVYPSAYANGYAVQVCKGTMPGLDGKKKCSGKYCSGKK